MSITEKPEGIEPEPVLSDAQKATLRAELVQKIKSTEGEAALLAEAQALLRQWLVTEIDPEDEEYEGWMAAFTVRATAVVNGRVAPREGHAIFTNGESNAPPVVGTPQELEPYGRNRSGTAGQGGEGDGGAPRGALRAGGAECGARAAGDEAGRGEVAGRGACERTPFTDSMMARADVGSPAWVGVAEIGLRQLEREVIALRKGHATFTNQEPKA